MSQPEFSTERLRLRPWRASDRGPFARMNGDPRVMEFFPATLDPEQSDALLEKIESHLKREGFGLLALESRESGEFLGFTGLSIPIFEADFTPCVEIGWRLAPEAWGYGYASEAARACLEWGFEGLGLDEIVSFTAAINQRSIAVMERIGMRADGRFDHPGLPEGHRLRAHVLYRISR